MLQLRTALFGLVFPVPTVEAVGQFPVPGSSPTPMPTPLPVDVENDWVDYTTAVGGVLGGLGAIAAAVVAIIAVRAQASATDRAERGQRRVAKQALYQEVFAYMASATKEPAVAANILGRMQVGASNAALEAWTRYTRDTSPENRDALMTVLNKELNELNTDAS